MLTVQTIPAGADATGLKPGDLVFVHRPSVLGTIIQLGQWVRPSLRPWSRWSHVAVLSAWNEDEIIEAHARGVVRGTLTEYRHRDYVIVRTALGDDDRDQALAYLNRQVGEGYGFLIFLSTALRMLTPGRGVWFGRNQSHICSGLAASALERGWYVFSQQAETLCPAELARELGVPHAE